MNSNEICCKVHFEKLLKNSALKNMRIYFPLTQWRINTQWEYPFSDDIFKYTVNNLKL